MDSASLIQQLRSTKEWFDRSSRSLTEEDSAFAPSEGMLTAAQQVAHVAWTVDWFLDGAFRNADGFDMDFEKEQEALSKVASITEARKMVETSFQAFEECLSGCSPEKLAEPLPEGPVMGGMPRGSVVGAIGDHTAHHRGALTVYSRLRGHVPAMPYMEME